MVGETLGNYRILRKLGKGGMGAVYLARDLSLEREVALKVISPELARNPGLMARFRVEAIAQAKLNHPNITAIHSFDQEKGTYYIVMEHVEGKTLKEVIKEKGKMPVQQALRVFSRILAGIAYAHSKGVVHRDIKPSNIFLTSGIDQTVKIGDFGIAKVEGIEGLTKTGSSLGSPLYSSPEQLLGKKTDARTDIYSLGITLYEMLSGRLPFKLPPAPDYKVIKGLLDVQPRRLSELDRSIPAAVAAVVEKSLAKSPADRYQSVRALEQEVDKLLRGIALVPQKEPQRMIKRGKRAREKKTAWKPAVIEGLKELKGLKWLKDIRRMPAQQKYLAAAGVLLLILIIIVAMLIHAAKAVPLAQTGSGTPGTPASQPAASNTADQFPTVTQPGPTLGQPPAAPSQQPEPFKRTGDITGVLKQMEGLLKKGDYSRAAAVGQQAIKDGHVSGEIYLKLAQAYFYDKERDRAREYYAKALELDGAVVFQVNYRYKKAKGIKGTLVITSTDVSFQPDNAGSRLRFSVPLSQIKDVSADTLADIAGIFKKKKKRGNPILLIKTGKKKYAVQVRDQDTKIRRFIKDIIDTLKK